MAMPLVMALLEAAGADRWVADRMSASRFRPIAGAGRMFGRVLDFDDRIEQGAANLGRRAVDSTTTMLNNLFNRGGGDPSGYSNELSNGMRDFLSNQGFDRNRLSQDLINRTNEAIDERGTNWSPNRSDQGNQGSQNQNQQPASRPNGQRSGVGVGGGQVIASGPAAQAMFGGMREAANQQLMNDAQRAYQARASTIMK